MTVKREGTGQETASIRDCYVSSRKASSPFGVWLWLWRRAAVWPFRSVSLSRNFVDEDYDPGFYPSKPAFRCTAPSSILPTANTHLWAFSIQTKKGQGSAVFSTLHPYERAGAW